MALNTLKCNHMTPLHFKGPRNKCTLYHWLQLSLQRHIKIHLSQPMATLQPWPKPRRLQNLGLSLNSSISSVYTMLMSWNRIRFRYGQILGRPSLMRLLLCGGSDFKDLTSNICYEPKVNFDDTFTVETWLNILGLFSWILLTLWLLQEWINWFEVLIVTSLTSHYVISWRTYFQFAEIECYWSTSFEYTTTARMSIFSLR